MQNDCYSLTTPFVSYRVGQDTRLQWTDTNLYRSLNQMEAKTEAEQYILVKRIKFKALVLVTPDITTPCSQLSKE